MTVALVCVALLGLLLIALGFAVSTARGQENVLIGSPEDPTHRLQKLVRAHGNTAEYAPMFAVLIYALGTLAPATWVLWCMGIAVGSRYLIVAGLIFGPSLAEAHPLRFVGALGTYLAGAALCVALLLHV
jgi:uncharacterized membrane protein YecN with MAPEG domain